MYYEITDCIDKPRYTYATTPSEAMMIAERLFAGIADIKVIKITNGLYGIYEFKDGQQIHHGNIWKFKGKCPLY